MSVNELENRVERLLEWEDLVEQARSEADAIRDEIKSEMLAQDKEEIVAGKYIVRWSSVLSNRFDTTAFKKAHGDLYQSFVKQVSSRRFSVAA